MTMHFKPIREDGRSYRDVAVETLKDMEPEAVATYKELGAALDLSPKNDLQKIQMAVRAANIILLKRHSRGVRNVPTVGYRVLPARENMVVAGSHQTRADKAMVRALTFYEGTNLGEMTEIERRLHQGQHMLAQAVMASHRQVNRRMDKIEGLLAGGKTVQHE